mgnify:CR=1 FL=1
MRKLIIRTSKGHETLDLDTEAAIQQLEALMNQGMLAVAATGEQAVQVTDAREAAVREAEEVRLFWPLAGGR